ncbi:receptor-like protein 12 [Solanum tuberosum]|uniref:receptor-like protein 12 n=1 Tax=Solanum tuberosum TaxID=4113 RepID=UPI00073A1DB9|nr:PREDICTED: receptor-like protein 12 [Solanum tuberosum]
MTTIDLSSNHFEGVIPKTLKDLSSLWLLNLSHNNLIGHIPMELGQLNTLEALDLSWNWLTGNILQELTRMNFLAFLNVSQNHLVGPIPHGLQFNTFENYSYGGNLDLCGLPLSKQCGTSDSSHVPQPLESAEEGESYFFSGFSWELVVIGYSFGLVVGTVMWSLMFKYHRLHAPRPLESEEEEEEESLCFSSSFDHHLCSPTEASALLQFKQSFGVDYNYSKCFTSFPKRKSWNESRDCCSWDGVTCDLLNGHVIGLDLSCSLLSGSIHPNSTLFQLHHLQALNLAYNHFSYSSIPHNIGRLTNLVSLDLSSDFYGLQLDERTFETMLQNLTNLEVLSLFLVNISSPMPVNISSSLRYLDLRYTNLRGVLTESFFLLPNSLETLKLSGNDLLKGVFPKIHRSNTLLMELDISYTGISGELPHSIGTFSSLKYLNLQGCQFSGSIPNSIDNLTQITELILSYNHFTGHIPSTISKLKYLTNLHLSDNSFSGEIPDVFSNLKELRYLDLFNNSFIGPFPASILSLTHLEYLGLSSNSLSGPLPSKASMLQKLSELHLSYNSLNGTIPSWVFNLPLLSSSWLNHNQFSGLADEIKTNPTLEFLYLNNNQLSGSFPQSLVNLTNLSTLDLSSNNITIDEGMNITFPSLEILQLSSCELKDFPHLLRNVKTLQVLDISNNKICGQIPNWFSGMRMGLVAAIKPFS